MARFYAGIHGNRGATTRLGTKGSGMRAFVNGWNVGVEVKARVNREGLDVIQVLPTGGSNGGNGFKVETDPDTGIIRIMEIR